MNYQTYNNYHYHKSKAVWWLHRRVDNEYDKKTCSNSNWICTYDRDDPPGLAIYPSKLIQRITEDLK